MLSLGNKMLVVIDANGKEVKIPKQLLQEKTDFPIAFDSIQTTFKSFYLQFFLDMLKNEYTIENSIELCCNLLKIMKFFLYKDLKHSLVMHHVTEYILDPMNDKIIDRVTDMELKSASYELRFTEHL